MGGMKKRGFLMLQGYQIALSWQAPRDDFLAGFSG
jgi:hypothetical protein